VADHLAVLDARDVEIDYQRGGELAVRALTLRVAAGEGLLLTGARGSGKTTLLRAICGLTRFRGEIRLFGDSPPADPAVVRRIGYGPEGRTFTAGLTPQELVTAVATLRTGSAAVAAEALTRAGVAGTARGAKSLDIEDARRVALACAITGDPDLLLLDDPFEFTETHDEIARARARGAAVIVATHDPGCFAPLLGRTVTLPGGGDE
jgi:ABC-type multidrug transport system ATPase subunit